jgi:hypothetical protein
VIKEHRGTQSMYVYKLLLVLYLLDHYHDSMTPELLTDMLAAAGVVNCMIHHNVRQQLAAVTWLRAHGAVWPDILQYHNTSTSNH